MADNDLRRLSRAELVEIIYRLKKLDDGNQAELARLRAQLDDRTIRVADAGSIAEAALRLNGVFEAAQAAADQYLESVRAVTADSEAARLIREAEERIREAESRVREAERVTEEAEQRREDAERYAAQIISNAKNEAARILAEADRQAAERRESL